MDSLPSSSDQVEIALPQSHALPPTPEFSASELLEALFLEEPKPIVIFDAADPELIAIRLLTALWPSIRKRFALSTFALSPRRIEGRDFDLLFAPKDARPKFADWFGRRIDGRSEQRSRHRWTQTIVDRVFNDPMPRLLDDRELDVIGRDEVDAGAALRIALLWDELQEKLGRSPSAALGLLDIANSRMPHGPETFLALAPLIADAAHRAVDSLPESEAWDLIGALARKVQGTPTAATVGSIASAASALAEKSPTGAIGLLNQPDPHGATESLVPAIAEGMARHFGPAAIEALLSALPETLARLLSSEGSLPERVADDSIMVDRLAEILPTLQPEQFVAVRRVMLPLLTEDRQLPAARPLLASLDEEALIAETQHLILVNGFEADAFVAPLVARARSVDAIARFRDALLAVRASDRRDQILRSTLVPSLEDVLWLVRGKGLDSQTREGLLVDLLRTADTPQLRSIFGAAANAKSIIEKLPYTAVDVLRRTIFEIELPLALQVTTTLKLIEVSPGPQILDVAIRTLERCLRNQFGGDEVGTIATLLATAGDALDGGWVVQSGLGKGIDSKTANRNLIAFQRTPSAARARIVQAVEEMAQALESRRVLGLDERGAKSCAQLLRDAESVNPDAALRASGRLLPLLLRSRQEPVSILIASTFPLIYRELAKEDDIPDLLKFVPFLDWDRCKAARRELVEAFISSPVWEPNHLALTACLCADVEKILGRTVKSPGGERYAKRLLENLHHLPDDCRDRTLQVVSKLHSKNG